MSAPQVPTDENDERENILGQFIYAFGQGAGSIRVSRCAIAALRRRYGSPIQASVESWEAKAAYVLPLLSHVGRLAALLATQAGRPFIAEVDFTQARRQVEDKVHGDAERSGTFLAGPLCPPTAEDVDPAIVPASDMSPADRQAPCETFARRTTVRVMAH